MTFGHLELTPARAVRLREKEWPLTYKRVLMLFVLSVHTPLQVHFSQVLKLGLRPQGKDY